WTVGVGRSKLNVSFFSNFAQSRQPFINTPERLASLIHTFPGEIKWHAVMHTQQRVTELAPGVTFRQNIWHRVKITQRFGHLLSVDQQMRTMQPIADEFFSGHAFALCNLSFVVRKNVIDAAAMDINLIAD